MGGSELGRDAPRAAESKPVTLDPRTPPHVCEVPLVTEPPPSYIHVLVSSSGWIPGSRDPETDGGMQGHVAALRHRAQPAGVVRVLSQGWGLQCKSEVTWSLPASGLPALHGALAPLALGFRLHP